MSLAFALPLGHPPADLPVSTRSARLVELRGLLGPDATPFSGDDVLRACHIQGNAPAWATGVFALCGGTLSPQGDSLLTIELSPNDARELAARLLPRSPVPRRVTFGPVVPAGLNLGAGSQRVESGRRLGTLSGGIFRLGFEDQDSYWIDPAWCLAAFDAATLWDLPAGSPNPLAVLGAGAAGQSIAMAGAKIPSLRDRPMLALGGGGRQPQLLVFNPPEAGLPGRYLSFVSSDTVTVGVFHLPPGHTMELRVEDRTVGTARSTAAPFVASRTSDNSIVFKPERDLRPSHPRYQPGAGADTVVAPLSYALSVDVRTPGGALITTLATAIEQDLVDVVRQAYVFHGSPFQSSASLPLPPAASFSSAPSAGGFIQPEQVYTSPYFAKGMALDSGALLRGAEFIRRSYSRRLFEDAVIAAAQQEHLSADLVVTRGWVDPELNEHFGAAVDSPAQWSVTLDLAPFHTHLSDLFLALVDAATDFLFELRSANPGQLFAETAVRLRKGDDELWRWTIDSTGLHDAAGARFAAVVGGVPSIDAAAAAACAAAQAATAPAAPTPTAAAAAEIAAARAAVISVTFAPRPLAAPLAAPPVSAYPPEPAAPAKLRNLIVLGTELPSIPQYKRVPIDVAGKSIERTLRTRFPQDELVTSEIGDPISLLAEFGAFRNLPPRRFRYVFVLSHAWRQGLQLTHSGGKSANDPSDDAALREVYGRRYALGTDEFSQFRTSQFRPSNLTKLPSEMMTRLKQSFTRAEGIFILGCTSGMDADGFSHWLAQALGVTVFGAGNFAKFYVHSSGSVWRELDVSRGSVPAIQHYNDQVMLLPATPRGDQIQLIDGDPLDVIELYRKQLSAFAPDGPEPAP